MILSDNETSQDLLNYKIIANAIVSVLEKSNEPLTIGIHGDWGAGKSSILLMIEETLKDKPNLPCLRFNSWRYQGFEDAKLALIEDIVTGLVLLKPDVEDIANKLKTILRRIDFKKIARIGCNLAKNLTTGLPTIDQIAHAKDIITKLVNKKADRDKIDISKETLEDLNKSLNFDDTSIIETMKEFREVFDELLLKAKIDKLVVLVDDLDRCLPKTVIDTLEAIRLFLFNKQTAFILASDEAMIEYSVRMHFPELPNSSGHISYSRSYLEKLIQVPFRIPSLGYTETRVYTILLSLENKLGAEDPDFVKISQFCLESIQKPWTAEEINFGTIEEKFKIENDEIKNEILFSEQISEILSEGTYGNPRQIKRFLNTLWLRNFMAELRGFADEINVAILAKLMLAEQFDPSFFKQIVGFINSTTDGICTPIKLLEDFISNTQDAETDKKEDPVSENEEISIIQTKDLLADWIQNSKIIKWAKIQPSFTDVDLRPYVFATRDGHDLFDSKRVPDHLQEILEFLMGSEMQVRGVENKIKLLPQKDIINLFNKLKLNVLSSKTFKTKPVGIEGLLGITRSNNDMEIELIDLFDKLLVSDLGIWVLSALSGVTFTENKDKYIELMNKWETQTENIALSTAVEKVSKYAKSD